MLWPCLVLCRDKLQTQDCKAKMVCLLHATGHRHIFTYSHMNLVYLCWYASYKGTTKVKVCLEVRRRTREELQK